MGKVVWKLVFLILTSVTLLVACGEPDPIPSAPTSSQQNQLPDVQTQPTESLPTAVILSTDSPAPAATVTIAPSSTATPTPTPTPLPVNLFSPDDFGENRNRLTGEEVDDPDQLQRRPIAVKISNAPAKWVRPQSGLNQADLIFEHITEAKITRFTMIIYGQTPPAVGPIRSARLIDLELPAMYDSALIYSGSSAGVRQLLLSSDFRPRILLATSPGYYRTGADKPLEHTLYGKPEIFWEVLEEKGLNQLPTFNTQMAFTSEPPPGGTPASDVTIDYDWTLINWRYDLESGRYLRWVDGKEHLDANTDEQVKFANVAVILANHIEDPDICEQIINGVCTAFSVQPQIFGSGQAIIFRDGQRFDGTWERIGRYDLLTFKDDSGEPLPLQIGNTWFQIIPFWYDDAVRVAP